MAQIEKIKAEIERLKHTGYAYNGVAWELLGRLENFINSLQAEPVSEDLEEAFCHYAETIDNYPSNQDEEKYMYNVFQAGAQWQREQILKGAVEVTVKELDLQSYWHCLTKLKLVDADKVKVILIKED